MVQVTASTAPEATIPDATMTSGDLKGQQANILKLQQISRDFRTDTITMPTDEMYDLMKHASRGDDVYGTNQLAIRTHLTQPPHSIILDARSHVHLYEAGGVAFHSQATSHAVPPRNGHHLTLEEVLDNAVFGEDIHSAPTKLVALENTLSGMVFPQEEIIRISDCMRANGIIMHCDGARMWEVVAKTGMSLEELCRPFDTVSLCMSKGLGAPIGSMSRRKTNPTFLSAETNMLWLDPSSLGFPISTLAQRAKLRGITLGSNRIVVHHQITREACDDLIALVRELKEEFKDAENKRVIDQAQNLRFAQGTYEGQIQPPIARLGTSYGKNQ
ncbi:SPOSA6832_02938, partial [Sporobolomyces salmonicolor]